MFIRNNNRSNWFSIKLYVFFLINSINLIGYLFFPKKYFWERNKKY